MDVNHRNPVTTCHLPGRHPGAVVKARNWEALDASHAKMPAEEAGDRLAIRELFDAYAHCADQPTQELHGRESLAPVFDNLNTYQATMHFNGQSTVVIDGDGATGESYCIAHHLYEVGGQGTLMMAFIRYLDQFARQSDGSWLFAERKLMVEWTETRPSNPRPGEARNGPR